MKKKILAVFLSLCMAMSLLPVTALAAGEEAISITSGTTELSTGSYILNDDITLSEQMTVPEDQNVTINLNGHVLSLGKKSLTNKGTLTIQDDPQNQEKGKIASNSNPAIQNGGTLTVKDNVTIETTGAMAVKGTKSTSSFTLEDGTITGKTYGFYGTANQSVFKEGTINGKINATSGKVIIGTENGQNASIVVNGDVTISESTVIHCGDIKNITGDLKNLSSLKCILRTDISSKLPAGKALETGSDTKGTYYTIIELDQSKAEAKIGEYFYASAAAAAKALQDNETLTLLKDVTGDTSNALLASTAKNATIDLNGKSVTNTNEKGTAISMKAKNSAVKENFNATVTNSSEVVSNIIAATAMEFSSGNSKYTLTVNLTGNISLDNSENIELGTGSKLAYSEDAAKIVGNGGFKADEEDGSYIYGSFATAAKNDKDGTVKLLNNYRGSAAINWSSNTATLDLQGHTYEYTGTGASSAAIQMNTNSDQIGNEDASASLTIKSGKIVSAADGAIVLCSNNSLTLDDVDLIVYGSDYGIVSNGTYKNNNLTLQNGTVLLAENALGIYWPSGNGRVTIDNSAVTAHTGIQVCAGGLVVKGEETTITATGTPIDKTGNDGGISDGAAISIVKRDGYQNLGTVSIENGTFTSSVNSKPVKAYTFNNTDKTEHDWDKAGDVVSVSGGNFSSPVEKKYLADGLNTELYDTGKNPDAPFSYYSSVEAAQEAATNEGVVTEVAGENETSHQVTLDYGNGDKKVVQGTSVVLPDVPDQGYNHFVGWNDGSKTYDAGTQVPITADTTFTAVWSYIPPANPNYRIDIPAAEGGTVTADPAAAKAGATVTLTATPDEGYAVGTITVTDRFGDAVKVTENADGTYTFTMPNGQVTVKATFVQTEEPAPAMPFTDVHEGDWFYEEVLYAYENGLMNGVGDNRFAPNSATTRGMLVTILYRLEGEPAVTGEAGFDDVAAGQWYTDAVIWAAANDIVNGIGDNQFGPENTLTREQLVTMLYRYAQNKGYDVTASADLSGYPDAGQIQSWAQDAMTWAVAEGIVEGMDGNLNPAGHATRAQIATILMRFCEGVAK